MHNFESVDFLEPGRTYLRLERQGHVHYIDPLNPHVSLYGRRLYMGELPAGHMAIDADLWLFMVNGELREYTTVEVVVGATNRPYDIGEHEERLDAQDAHDWANGR